MFLATSCLYFLVEMNKAFTFVVFVYLLIPGKYYILRLRLSLAINITHHSSQWSGVHRYSYDWITES